MAGKVEKILVCGDVEGRLNQLFKRISNVNEKNGPFSMLLCVGEFFGSDNSQWLPYKRGDLKVPLPTYILGPHHPQVVANYPDLKGCELCENVIYLGPSGIYPCSNGLKIMYLSGMETDQNKTDYSFIYSDIQSLETQATNKPTIDILITGQWPSAVCNFAKIPDGCDLEKNGSKMVSRLAFKVQPRYHFCGLEGVYYERLPYRNHKVLNEPTRHVTRFIGLAKVGNSEKQKWLYAFNITPMIHCDTNELNKQPPDVTECPYSESNVAQQQTQAAMKSSGGAQFFYDMNAKYDDDKGRKRKGNNDDRGGDKKRGPPKPTGPCWFCLASPEVEKHLVVSVGNHAYVALAKGGLVSRHLLILPITHFQSTPDLDEDCREEIEKFKAAIKRMFKKQGQAVVFFERNYRSQHLQVQVIPIPLDTTSCVMDQFMDIASSNAFELDEIPKLSDISQVAPPGTPFFYAELPTGEKLYHRIKKNFPLQFGREVLASSEILNVPERIDWRECKISKDEETNHRDKIRTAFQPYDFTLEDDSD